MAASPKTPTMRVVTLCTGNATRSVIAQLWLQRERPDLEVCGGGTLSIEGLPMSTRTRSAMAEIGLQDPGHRSHQLEPGDVAGVDLILAMEADHVRWIRREVPASAHLAITVRRLVRDLASADNGAKSFGTRLAALDPGAVSLQGWEDVIDPAGGDQAEFDRCAKELDGLLGQLAPLLDPPRRSRQ